MSLLCPIDFRYGRPKMRGIFEEDSRLERLLEVEAALARAEAKVGLIPKEAAAEITKKATTKNVTVSRVEELEKETRHDLMAVVLALTEACGDDAGRYVHLGATSSDILDTATALQLREAIRLIDEDLDGLIDAFTSLASKHKRTIMLGRTHGQAAVPITFGLKMAVFASEVARQRERLREATPRVIVGKMSGAVGTGAAFGPQASDIQSAVMADIGVGVEEAATQVVGRDRHAEFIGVLANLAASLEKFCTEVRNLQRTEIAEVAEAFEAKQVEQRGGTDHPAPRLRPDRRDARADDGDLPNVARLSGPHEGEPRGDERPGHGGVRDDRPRRERARTAGGPPASARTRAESAYERHRVAGRAPRRPPGDEAALEEGDRRRDGPERVPGGERRDRRCGREADPLDRTLWTPPSLLRTASQAMDREVAIERERFLKTQPAHDGE